MMLVACVVAAGTGCAPSWTLHPLADLGRNRRSPGGHIDGASRKLAAQRSGGVPDPADELIPAPR